MASPTRGGLRELRAASLGFVGFVFALVAHQAAGGVAPRPGVLLLLAGLTVLAAVLLTGLRLSLVRIGVSLALMQVVLHEAFMKLSVPAGCAMDGMSTTSMLDCTNLIARTGVGQPSDLRTTLMVGAHVAAAALMVALLAYGENVLWFLAGYLRPLRWLRIGPPWLPASRIVSSGTPRVFRVRFADGGVGRRGPPPRSPFAIV